MKEWISGIMREWKADISSILFGGRAGESAGAAGSGVGTELAGSASYGGGGGGGAIGSSPGARSLLGGGGGGGGGWVSTTYAVKDTHIELISGENMRDLVKVIHDEEQAKLAEFFSTTKEPPPIVEFEGEGW